MPPNDAHQWRAAQHVRYATEAQSARPLNAPGLGGVRLKIATVGAAVSYHFAAIPTFQLNTTSEGRSFCRIALGPLRLLTNLKHRILMVEINQKAGLHIGAAFGTRSFFTIHSLVSILRAACFAA
jgi:hypothetical protein